MAATVNFQPSQAFPGVAPDVRLINMKTCVIGPDLLIVTQVAQV